MTGLPFEYSTSGIENRSISTDSFPTNETFALNCTTIECFDRAPRVINSPWFIGLIVSLIVLMIVIAIVCGILKRKGGKYSVQDKEMLHGPSGYAEDEAKFSEYYRAPSDVSIKRSRTSLNNGDDRDSMAEFNDEKDRSRFQEDGSFIGQYGRDDLRRSYLIKTDEHEVLDPGKSLSNI